MCPCGASQGNGEPSSEKDWLSLVDELLDNLNATITKYSLNVHIVLDGTANPTATRNICLVDRWRPLLSLFTAEDGNWAPTPQTQCIYDASPLTVPEASLWSDNATFGWDRQMFLNNPAEQWPAAAAEKWGKFESRRGPLICWEPSDQTDVQDVYKIFSASGSDHADGVLIASNVDPAMFQVKHAPLRSGNV